MAKKLVPLLRERAPAAKPAIGSGPEKQAPFDPIMSEIGFLTVNVKMCRDTAVGNARQFATAVLDREWLRDIYNCAIRLIGLKFARTYFQLI